MPELSAIVILNCGSGCSDAVTIAQQLECISADMGVACEIVMARSAAELLKGAQAAARSRHDIVIAGGGDGTINAIASELVGTGKRLGVLPLGTFNYFAKEKELPADLESAFRACFEGETRSVAVGEVNGRVFLNNASIGLYPVVIAIREQTYRRWGRHRLAAYWSVLKAVRHRLNMKLTIVVDGERRTIRTPMLFVGRNTFQMQEFHVPGTRCIAADGLSVYALRPMGKPGLLRLAWHALARRLAPHYDFEMFCANELRVESDRMLRAVVCDGERMKMLAPLEFRVRQHALELVVPKTTEKETAA
jgi:diacylglycerol kinase family enzyme